MLQPSGTAVMLSQKMKSTVPSILRLVEVQIIVLCYSPSAIFSPRGIGRSLGDIIYLSMGFNSSLFVLWGIEPALDASLMASSSTYHSTLYPCHAASKVRQVPEFIARNLAL